MASNVPSSRHLANRAYTDCQGPYVSDSSRHCAPLRAIQSIPFSILRSSFRGRPRFPALSGGNSSFMRSHCSFLNSYRFISLFLHERSFCAIFIFQTSPKSAKYFCYSMEIFCVFFLPDWILFYVCIAQSSMLKTVAISLKGKYSRISSVCPRCRSPPFQSDFGSQQQNSDWRNLLWGSITERNG